VTTDDPGLSAALAAIWERQRGEMLRRVDVIEDALAALVDDRLDEPARADAEGAAHKVAGSAGSFGFARASQSAREIELALRDGSAAADAARLLALARELRADFTKDGGSA
jgi:HPt (histidine-containing phosphotransfer) domain-containing protein